MSEKNKWYDSKRKREPEKWPEVVATSSVTVRDAQEVMAYAEKLYERKRIPLGSKQMMVQLCQLHPVDRLSRNLRTLLSLLAKGPVDNVIRDGLTGVEVLLLLDLEHAGASSELRARVQGLLNVNERQQLVYALSTTYRDERTRRWDLTDEQ